MTTLSVLPSVSWGIPAKSRGSKLLDVRQFRRSTSTTEAMETENEDDLDAAVADYIAGDRLSVLFALMCPEGARHIRRSRSTPEIKCNDDEDGDDNDDDDLEIVFLDDVDALVQQADEDQAECEQSESEAEAEAEAKEWLAICQPSGKLCESAGYYRGKRKQKKHRRKTKGEENMQKKKKWKQVGTEELDFLNLSLFPRVPYTETEVESQAYLREEQLAVEYDQMEEKVGTYASLEEFSQNTACKFSHRYLRPDRDRKLRKATRQVKDKYCRSIRNNRNRRTLFVHHRVMKLMNLEAAREGLHIPGAPQRKLPEDLEKPRWAATIARPSHRPAPAQNLAHAADRNNFADDLPLDVINVLIAMQHREVTAEDYEILLRLDDGIAPKTLSEGKLKSFKTDTVDASSAGMECAVCMDVYEIGQVRKFLPCGHNFHGDCIDNWLRNSSMNCPLDGLPVSES